MQLHLNIMESTARTLKVRLGQTHYLQDKSITPFEVVCALKVQRCFRDMKARKLDDMSLKEKAVSRRRNAVADCGSPLARTGDGSPRQGIDSAPSTPRVGTPGAQKVKSKQGQLRQEILSQGHERS